MKALFKKYYQDLFLSNRIFAGLGLSAVLFLCAFFLPWLEGIPVLFFWVLMFLILADLAVLYRTEQGVFARREMADRLSNGEDNTIRIYLENKYPFAISAGIIDEIPYQFQKRDVWFSSNLTAGENQVISYELRPLKRGEYLFGRLRVYISSPLGLLSRRYDFGTSVTVPVYPSFLQLRKYELMAVSNRLSEMGIKKIRRVGHSMEFDQVKSYVQGDDYRSVNWKATARKGELMVNSYIDEKAQQVYCIIDKSRVMKMPFEGLSLLDYAINATLILSSVALVKEDKAGLITISEKVGAVVPAERRPAHLGKIMEVLYKEKSRYLETNIEELHLRVRQLIRQRSLLVYFTNFETMSALQRQLPFLRQMARFHLLLIVIFENTELRSITATPAADVEGIYIKTIADKFAHEKKLMVKELAKHGILSILTPPAQLTVNVVNRYLDIKAQQKI